MMTPRIVKIQTRPGYRLVASFQNGEIRELDVTPYLSKGVFQELKDERYFNKVRSIGIGIEWPHEQDLSAETLYYQGNPLGNVKKSSK